MCRSGVPTSRSAPDLSLQRRTISPNPDSEDVAVVDGHQYSADSSLSFPHSSRGLLPIKTIASIRFDTKSAMLIALFRDSM
jgi:hypothetical protein